MDFHGLAFLVTIMIILGNGAMYVLLSTPAFGVIDSLSEAQAKQISDKVLPLGLEDVNAINNTELIFSDIKDTNGNFWTTVTDAAQLASTSFIKVENAAKYLFNFVIFMIVGYVFVLQIADVPGWFTLLVGLIIVPIQMFGFFYIGTYLYSVLKGRIA